MKLHRLLLPVGLMAALIAPAVTTTSISSVASPPQVVDVSKLMVQYQGRQISNAEAVRLQEAAEASHQTFRLVYDPISDAAGIAHAFDSNAAADAFGQKVLAELKQRHLARQKNGAMVNAGSTYTLPAGCIALGDAYNISRLFVNGSCGGNWWVFQKTDAKSTLGSLANQASSLETGRTGGVCTIIISLWPGPNYSYTMAQFYGDPDYLMYHTFNSVQNDNFESGKSQCS
jgi:hypothetical protein